MRCTESGAVQADEPDWPEHEATAGQLAAAVPALGARSELYFGEHEAEVSGWLELARRAPPPVVRSLVLLLVRRAGEEGGWSQDTARRVRGLGRARVRPDRGDAAYLLRTAAVLPDTWSASEVLEYAVALAARTSAGDPAAEAAAELVAASMTQRRYVPARYRTAILADLARLRGGGAADRGSVPVTRALRHLRSAPSRPTMAWLAEASRLLDDPAARGMVRQLLTAAAGGGPTGTAATDTGPTDTAGPGLAGSDAELLRAAAWAASAVHEPWVVPALEAIAAGRRPAGGPRPDRVRAACVTGLALIASAPAIESLRRLWHGAGTSAVRGQVGAALRAAGRRAGLGEGEIAERVVPRAGLDAGGQRVIAVGAVTARVTLTGQAEVQTRWKSREGWSDRVPAASCTAARQLVRAATGEVAQVLAAERGRLDMLLGQDREWEAALWRELYLEHPVTGPLSRRMIWIVTAPAGDLTGLPGSGTTLTTLDGTADLPCSGTVRLWHPARAGQAEILAWRALLAGSGSAPPVPHAQPVPQAWREVYSPNPAERADGAGCDRFAGSVLPHPAAIDALRERGWAAAGPGHPAGGVTGRACRRFPAARLDAVLDYAVLDYAVLDDAVLDDAAADDGEAGRPDDLGADRCVAGRLVFRRAGRRAGAPVRLDRVPGVVFSEAVRDITRAVTAP